MLSETLRQTSTCNGIRLAYICSVTNTGVPVTNMLFIATLRGALSWRTKLLLVWSVLCWSILKSYSTLGSKPDVALIDKFWINNFEIWLVCNLAPLYPKAPNAPNKQTSLRCEHSECMNNFKHNCLEISRTSVSHYKIELLLEIHLWQPLLCNRLNNLHWYSLPQVLLIGDSHLVNGLCIILTPICTCAKFTNEHTISFIGTPLPSWSLVATVTRKRSIWT